MGCVMTNLSAPCLSPATCGVKSHVAGSAAGLSCTAAAHAKFNAKRAAASTAGKAVAPLRRPGTRPAGAATAATSYDVNVPKKGREKALKQIGEALYNELPEDTRPVSAEMSRYGQGRNAPGRWRFEADAVTDAEIIPPNMDDTPEMDRQREIVSNIIRRNSAQS